MSTKLSYARLHTTIFAPSIGQLGPELNSKATNAARAIDMTLEGEVVKCLVPMPRSNKTVTMLVPIANFTNMVVEEAIAKDNKT